MSGLEQAPAPAVTAGIDISMCEREPIHIPSAIQPHGAFLAAETAGWKVTHASANLATILGRSAEAMLGRNLEEAIGQAERRALQATWQSDGTRDATLPGQPDSLVGPHGAILQLKGFRSGQYMCLDLAPMPRVQKSLVVKVQQILATFEQATSRLELCQLAVRGLRAITGYDRVMAYRFAADGHGEVIAEDCATDLESFLGLRYPASDVPQQARLLYLRKRTGVIPDADYTPVPLLTAPGLQDGTPLDLTLSTLRSISPVHLQYLRNMGVVATLRVTLTNGPSLWGLMLCHHQTRLTLGRDLQGVADMIGRVVSLQLDSLGKVEAYARRFERSTTLHLLMDQLASPMPLPDVLAAAEAELLHLVDAGGAVVRMAGSLRCIGHTPPPPVAAHLLATLLSGAEGELRTIDDLGLRHPEFAGHSRTASGALVLPLGPDGDDAVLWLRPELAQNVVWAGKPADHVTADPVTGHLTPRSSFAAWRETILGRSAPWSEADILLAGALRGPLETQIAQGTQAELVKLRSYDMLTGLPNRTLLRQRLAEAARENWASAALLFINVDDIKDVNDSIGHAAGDAVLIEVARRLLATAGPDHLVARLGGPEFVVLFRPWERSLVAELGERIRDVLAAPFETAGRSTRLVPTIRMVITDETDERGLLGAADAAMSEAKATIEQQRKVEAQRQKMEALGRMMGGVAHEINNMLQPVMILGQIILRQRLVVDEGEEHLGTMLDCIRKARQIIGDLLAFSRPTLRSKEVFQSPALLEDSLRLVRQAIPVGVVVDVRIEGHPPPIRTDRTSFAQILLNLATNAVAAMQGQGDLTIVLDEDTGGSSEIRLHVAKRFARLRVIDSGCGMTQATLERAFEPFYTTKAVGEGTGLGLPVVFGMVQEMGGMIALTSEPGSGTTVTISIPEADGGS